MLSLPGAGAPHPAPDAATAGHPTPDPIRQVEAIFSPLVGARGLLLAVSGGPDSMALLRLAATWRQGQACPPLHVATVDHQLRPAARVEAEQVAAWATAQGLAHHLLVWDGPKPKTRIQEAARDARYRLLADAALAQGLDHVVTAHHADDQAETVLFRLLRGSGIGGLAGMAPLTRYGAVTIARPLLGLTKDDLVGHCLAVGQPFVEDPSNTDPAYARTRMRRLGRQFAREGLDRSALLRLARRAARLEAALAPQVEAATASLVATHGADGSLRLDARPLATMPDEIVLRALRRQIEGLAPAHTIRLERLEGLGPSLRQAVQQGLPHAATLGGVVLRLDRAGWLTLRREAPRRRGHTSPFDETPA